MRILTRYFVARFVGLFLTALIAALLLLATVELVLNLDDLASFSTSSTSSTTSLSASSPSGASPASGSSLSPDMQSAPTTSALSQAFRYLWVRLAAYYLTDLLPIASFIAMFITFAWAGRAMELVAIQTGGVCLARVIAPVLVTALILSLASALAHETLVLRASQIWTSETQQTRDDIDFDRRSFWYHKGRTITNIAYADPETRTLHGVEVFERGESGQIVRVVRAERVEIAEDGRWRFFDAAIWEFDPLDPGVDPRFEMRESLSLDLTSIQGDALLSADPRILSLRQLGRYLEAHPDPSSARRRLECGYHERQSSPWLVFAFSWLALPFALRVDGSGRFARPAAAAVLMLGLYFLCRSASATLAREDLLPAALTPWLTMFVFVAGAGLGLWRRPRWARRTPLEHGNAQGRESGGSR